MLDHLNLNSRACAQLLSHVWLFVIPRTVARQAPLSMGFPRQEHWSGLPCPSGNIPNPGIEPASPALAAGFFTTEPPGKSYVTAYVHAKSLQSCPTLCDPMDCSPPGSVVHGILQARTLEWVALPSSRGSSQPRDGTHVSCGSWLAGRFFTEEPLGKSYVTASCCK